MEHNCKTLAGIKPVQPLTQLLGIFPSYSFSQLPCSGFEQWWEILHLQQTKITRRKYDRWLYVSIKIIIIFIILNGFLPNFYYLKFSALLLGIFYSKCRNYKKIQCSSADKQLRHYFLLIKVLKVIATLTFWSSLFCHSFFFMCCRPYFFLQKKHFFFFLNPGKFLFLFFLLFTI